MNEFFILAVVAARRAENPGLADAANAALRAAIATGEQPALKWAARVWAGSPSAPKPGRQAWEHVCSHIDHAGLWDAVRAEARTVWEEEIAKDLSMS